VSRAPGPPWRACVCVYVCVWGHDTHTDTQAREHRQFAVDTAPLASSFPPCRPHRHSLTHTHASMMEPLSSLPPMRPIICSGGGGGSGRRRELALVTFTDGALCAVDVTSQQVGRVWAAARIAIREALRVVDVLGSR
jgi:hypothetical protein